MRIKDYTDPTFVFGEHSDGCVDVACGQSDVLTHVTRPEAQTIIGLMNERAGAINWLLDHVSSDVRSKFSDLIQTHEMHKKVCGLL